MSTKLHEDRAEVWAQMETMVKEGAENWDADATTKYSNLESEYRSLTEKIEAEDRFAKLSKPQGSPVSTTPQAEDRSAEYSAAFEAYWRRGIERMSSEQRDLLVASESRTMSTGTDSEGGYLVPENVRNQIIEALKDFGGLRSASEVLTTSDGQPLRLPKNDDTGNVGEIISENTEVSDEDLVFDATTLGAFIYSSKFVTVPVSLLEDSAVPLDSYIGRKLGERIGRLQADHWINGDGTTEPEGILVARDTSKDVNTTAAMTYENLVDLSRAVDPAYRKRGAAFVMADATAGAVRKLKGTQNDHPLWEPSMTAGDPDRILGYPVVIDNDMPADTAGKQPVAFGAWNDAYIIRDVKGIATLRLAELFARFRQVGFVAFVRSDGRVKDTAAYAVIDRTS